MISSDSLALPGIAHGFFTRHGGHSEGVFASLNCGLGSGDDKSIVALNRATVAKALEVEPDHLLTAFQVHSAEAVPVSGPWQGTDRPKVDGLVTATPGVAIGILTADCGPVLFADAKARVVGAAHAGWKGALGGVTEATLRAMEALGAQRADITVVLGPMISQAAYEVGPEFIGHFLAADTENKRFFQPSRRAGHAMFDLPGYLTARLSTEGVGQIEDLARCTYADEGSFFSYRRATHRAEKDYGRQISAIALR